MPLLSRVRASARSMLNLLYLVTAPIMLGTLLFADGGDGGGTDGGDGGDGGDPDDDDAGDLGDAGKRALADERAARKAAEREAKAAKKELDGLRASTATEHEKALAAAKDEGKAEALRTANARLLKSEIKAAAAGKLADPTDAVRLLDTDDFTDDNGEVDAKKLEKAVEDLLREKPYLAGKGARPSGDGGNGPRGGDPSGKSFLADAIRNRRR